MNPIITTLVEGAWPGLVAAGAVLALLPWIKRDGVLRVVAICAAIILALRYIIWRVVATIPPMSQTVDWAAGCIFYGIELAAVAGTILSLITLMRTRDRSPDVEANLAWLWNRLKHPLVDVFICTYNEEKEILERTIVGAMAMKYPNYRVWVLDDGRRPWLKDLADELGCNYLTRPNNEHAKAGNINHALKHVTSLPETPDFISILDADFVPTAVFLSRTLSLFREEDVGVVQTPQHFINPDPIQANLQAADAWPDEQRYFFDVVQPAKDAWGTAFCCGTSSVIRVDALRLIGGFPTDSVTEDYLVTLRLLQLGYRTIYLNERLSLGLAPEGLKEYVTQRSRWCLGFIQIFRSHTGPFKPGNGLRFIDRLSLIESFLYWSAAYLFRIAGFIVPILYLQFDIHAVDVDVVEGISHFLPYYVMQISIMAWLSERRILPVMTDLSQLLAAREILTAVAVGLFKPKGHKFKVTAKGGDRSKIFVEWRIMAMFLVLLAFTISGVLTAFYFDTDRALQDSSTVALYWSWYNIAILITAIAVCIERPRVRKNERLETSETVTLAHDRLDQNFAMRDISIGGIRLAGEAPADVGSAITVQLGPHNLRGRIARRSNGEFAIKLEETLSCRMAMILNVYSGRYRSGVREVKARNVARRILARLLH